MIFQVLVTTSKHENHPKSIYLFNSIHLLLFIIFITTLYDYVYIKTWFVFECISWRCGINVA